MRTTTRTMEPGALVLALSGAASGEGNTKRSAGRKPAALMRGEASLAVGHHAVRQRRGVGNETQTRGPDCGETESAQRRGERPPKAVRSTDVLGEANSYTKCNKRYLPKGDEL